MQPKVILSPAYAARVGMSDVDLASLFAMELLRVVPASENNTCPQCGNHADDSYVQLLTYEPAETPEKVSGRRIVWCLCEARYSYACVHAMDAEQAPGQARVRAASDVTATPSSDPTPTPDAAPTPDDGGTPTSVVLQPGSGAIEVRAYDVVTSTDSGSVGISPDGA